MYDDNNIFAKIIRKEIPCELVYEDEKVLFFNDINPKATIHILGVPKNSVINLREFISSVDKDSIKYFFDVILFKYALLIRLVASFWHIGHGKFLQVSTINSITKFFIWLNYILRIKSW